MAAVLRGFVLAVGLALCASMATAQSSQPSLEGWRALQDAINGKAANKIVELNGREFPLKLSSNATDLVIKPMAPFELSGSGNTYSLKIVNASSLVEDQGGLLVKKTVDWGAKVSGSADFPLSISGLDECMFNLTFRQDDGSELDLSTLRNAYEVTWQFDNPSAIASGDINGRSLQVRRVKDNNDEVSVTLRLKAKSGPIDVKSKPVKIQKCAAYVKTPGGGTGIIQVRTPAQCVYRTAVKEDEYKTSTVRGENYKTTFVNSCDVPVSCDITWQMFRYDSVADGINRINGTKVAWWRKTLAFTANGALDENFHLETTDINYPYYSWTNPYLADGAVPGFREPAMVCSWA